VTLPLAPPTNGDAIDQDRVITALRSLRSFLAVLAVGGLFALGSPVLRLYVLPTAWLFPELVSWFMKWMSRNIFRLLSLGGARIRRSGRVPTETPVIVVANHQSLLDICQATLLSDPFVPAFVTRRRYGRFVPLVSASLRMLGSPLIDPSGTPGARSRSFERPCASCPTGS
jgi:1-acyl-sn-glycerol-3-phosphate acyltransferase